MADMVNGSVVRHRAQFRDDLSNHCGDMLYFINFFCKMAAVCHLEFI